MLKKCLIAVLLNCVLPAQGASKSQPLFKLEYDDSTWWNWWYSSDYAQYDGFYAEAGFLDGAPYYQQDVGKAIIFIDAGPFVSTIKMTTFENFQRYQKDAPVIDSTTKYADIADQSSIGNFKLTKIDQHPKKTFLPETSRLSKYQTAQIKSEAETNLLKAEDILNQIDFGNSVLSNFVSPGRKEALGLFGPYTGAFGFLIGAEAPDEVLILEFDMINARIDQLSIELADHLDTSEEAQICVNKISESEDLITEILELYSNFLKEEDEDQEKMFLDQMTAVCSNKKCTFAIKKILSVLTPQGKLLQCDYLKLLYDGQSNKHGIEGFDFEMSKEITRLVLKVSQGINVLAALDMLQGKVKLNQIRNYYDKTFMDEFEQAQANIKYYSEKSEELAKDPQLLQKDIKKYIEYYAHYHRGTRTTQQITDEVFGLLQDRHRASDMEIIVVTFLAKSKHDHKDYYIISDDKINWTHQYKDDLHFYVALIDKNYGGGNFEARNGQRADAWTAYSQLQGGLQQICSNGGIAVRKERSPAVKSSSITKLDWNGKPEYPSNVHSQTSQNRRNNFGYYYRHGNQIYLYSFGSNCS